MRKQSKKVTALLVPLITILVGVSVYALLMIVPTLRSEKLEMPVEKVADTPKPVVVPEVSGTVNGRYLFSGTIVLARAVEKYAVDSKGVRDYNQPFSQLDTFEREKYDAWSTDFECPITNNVVPYSLQISNLVFNCPPEFLPGLTKYFNLFNLANNHTDNQDGQVGIESTRKYFEQYGVQYHGNYDPELTDDICEVIALPIRVTKDGGAEEKAALPVAFCAWHFFNYGRGPTDAELEPAREYAKYMPVFGFAEMGAEYLPSAGSEQRTIARQIIDTGAEFMLGNNPHWVQDSEVYKGKLIVYSMGNFIFDQIDDETERGVSIDATVTLPFDSNVEKWLTLGEECKSYKDSCLEQAKQQNLQKVRLDISYDAVANQNGARQVTRKASATVQAAVLQRLNWAETLRILDSATQE